MQKQDRRLRAETLAKDLANSTSPEVLFMRELIDIQYELTKEKLVEAAGDEVFKFQGEARCLDRIARQLTRPAAAQKTGSE